MLQHANVVPLIKTVLKLLILYLVLARENLYDHYLMVTGVCAENSRI